MQCGVKDLDAKDDDDQFEQGGPAWPGVESGDISIDFLSRVARRPSRQNHHRRRHHHH